MSDTLHDRITALTFASDDGTEYEHDHDPYDGHPSCPACWATTLRAVLAETTTAQPEADERRLQADAALAAAQPVEPEPDEREAAWAAFTSPGQYVSSREADAWNHGWAAGFRRSRPEATHTEWTVRHPDGRPIAGAQVLPDRTWIDDFALARWPGAIVVRREVSAWTTVADTPTQAGDDA